MVGDTSTPGVRLYTDMEQLYDLVRLVLANSLGQYSTVHNGYVDRDLTHKEGRQIYTHRRKVQTNGGWGGKRCTRNEAIPT